VRCLTIIREHPNAKKRTESPRTEALAAVRDESLDIIRTQTALCRRALCEVGGVDGRRAGTGSAVRTRAMVQNYRLLSGR
jgi:hypothetical protein